MRRRSIAIPGAVLVFLLTGMVSLSMGGEPLSGKTGTAAVQEAPRVNSKDTVPAYRSRRQKKRKRVQEMRSQRKAPSGIGTAGKQPAK